MAKKVWREDKVYCTRCRRYVNPYWDELRKLWACPNCHICVAR